MYPKGHTHKYASGAPIANVSGTQHGPTGEAQMEASIANVSGTQSGPIIETEIKASDVNVSEMKLDQINEAEAEAIKDVWERAFPRSDWETFVGKILHQDTSIFVGRVGEEQRIVSMAVVQTPNGASVADLFQDWLHGPGNAHEKPESDSETWSDNESSGQTRNTIRGSLNASNRDQKPAGYISNVWTVGGASIFLQLIDSVVQKYGDIYDLGVHIPKNANDGPNECSIYELLSFRILKQFPLESDDRGEVILMLRPAKGVWDKLTYEELSVSCVAEFPNIPSPSIPNLEMMNTYQKGTGHLIVEILLPPPGLMDMPDDHNGFRAGMPRELEGLRYVHITGIDNDGNVVGYLHNRQGNLQAIKIPPDLLLEYARAARSARSSPKRRVRRRSSRQSKRRSRRRTRSKPKRSRRRTRTYRRSKPKRSRRRKNPTRNVYSGASTKRSRSRGTRRR